MKQKSKAHKKTSATHKKAHAKTASYGTEGKMEEMKHWSDSVSQRFLANYAIPLTRLVEAKLVSLQHKV